MTDLEELPMKCYLVHTGLIADELEFKDWYSQRHHGLQAEMKYKATLIEAKAWLTGWR